MAGYLPLTNTTRYPPCIPQEVHTDAAVQILVQRTLLGSCWAKLADMHGFTQRLGYQHSLETFLQMNGRDTLQASPDKGLSMPGGANLTTTLAPPLMLPSYHWLTAHTVSQLSI